MNRKSYATRKTLLRSLLATLLMASVAAPALVMAAETSMAPSTDTTKMDGRVEARITSLHSKLGITADQESKWKDVTDVMHENADAIRPLIEARKANGASMNAVEDLKSYAQIADVHADGVKKFAAAFEPLYNSFSDAQKTTADAMFRKAGHRGAKHHHAKAAASDAAAK
jgi:hypothetical protein